MSSDLSDLEKAIKLADTADAITKKYYLSSKLAVETKPDTSPVTQADKEVEAALTHTVSKEFGDAYLGEEGSRKESNNDRLWVVDPIDGTRNFLRGMPLWATLIALRDADGPLVSLISAPALGRRWWATRGEGAFTCDTDGTTRKLHVSAVANIHDASLLYASLFTWDKTPVGVPMVLELLRSAWRTRAPGDFLNYMLVAEGAADATLEGDPKRWDIEAPALIIKEAGGSIWTSLPESAPADLPRISIASNKHLEPAILKALHLG